jgi:phosphoglycolate phosphatase-like HAD superfamily hydrolase
MSNKPNRDPSPELAEAEQSLRRVAALNAADFNYPERRDIGYAQAIADELTRLRARAEAAETELASVRESWEFAVKRFEEAEAKIASLQAAPSRTLYVPCKDAEDALNAITKHGFWTEDPAKVAGWVRGGDTVRVVELRVRP